MVWMRFITRICIKWALLHTPRFQISKWIRVIVGWFRCQFSLWILFKHDEFWESHQQTFDAQFKLIATTMMATTKKRRSDAYQNVLFASCTHRSAQDIHFFGRLCKFFFSFSYYGSGKRKLRWNALKNWPPIRLERIAAMMTNSQPKLKTMYLTNMKTAAQES